jgi:hypothetical protein
MCGPTGKSGTTYFKNLLTVNGLCDYPKTVLREENWLVMSNKLVEYARFHANNKHIPKDDEIRVELFRGILKGMGDSLLDFIDHREDRAKPLVLKKPNAKCLENFDLLFPDCKMVIVVRDGRETTESQIKAGFRAAYQDAFENWAKQCRMILNYMNAPKENPAMLFKYEDIVADPAGTATKVAEFMGVEGFEPDESAIAEMPVFGSAYVGVEGWQIVDKPKDFTTSGRWHHWDKSLREQFRDICGDAQQKLGYDLP